jgi:type I restriction enzyme S subunit
MLRGLAFDLIDQAPEKTPLGELLKGIDAGSSPLCPDRTAASGEWGVLKVSAVNPEGFRSDENKVVLRDAWIDPAYEVRDGDLLLSRANTFELVGAVCLVRSPRRQLLLCDKTLRLNPRPDRASADYLFWALRAPSVRRQIERDATGTSGSMKNISQKSLRALSVASRSLSEQRRIVAILDDHDARIRAAQAERDKLVALKRGLLDDLLTGRVRVPAARTE